MLLTNELGYKFIQGKNEKIPWDKWKWKHNNPKSMEHSKSSSNKEIHIHTGLPQQARKISNKPLT